MHPDLEVWRDHEGTICAYGGAIGEERWLHLPHLASFHFDGRSVRALAHPPPRPDLIREAYNGSVLPLLLQSSGTQVLHASAVLTDRGVVAFCAESGTGKSTLAFGLSQRGYDLWADDAVAFVASAAAVTSIQLPFALRLRGDDPSPSPAATLSSPSVPDRNDVRPLDVLFVLKRDRTARGIQVLPLPPSRAFPAVLTHAYCFSLRNAEQKRRMVAQYLELVARLPVFEIHFESGLEHVAAVLDEIERAVGQLRMPTL